ncbi:hypothetical protein AX16_010115 [Volvariella volvacea WC 439]|nr:hypothetical protein AX16_010115 [Volvariella volvacea WC 439]
MSTHTQDTGHAHNEHSNDSTETLTKIERTPLPKLQLFTVLLIQFTEPVTATVIYPFVNQFVRETGITNGDEKRVGYYAGVIESLFFISEALTVFQWCRASDRLGRRPILLLGPIGLALSMLSFGLSKTFWALVVSRCFQGICNGNIGVSKSVLGELTDATNMADAFAMIPLMWSVGTTVGPILGGIFARPAKRWPDTLGHIPFLKEYPYFLPCALASFIALASGLIATMSLKETLPAAIKRQKQEEEKKRRRFSYQSTSGSDASSTLLSGHPERTASYGSIDSLDSWDSTSTTIEENRPLLEEPEHQPPPPFRDLLIPPVLTVLANGGFLAFSEMALQVLQPLVWSTSIELGGLDFSPYQIGTTLGVWGILNAFVQIYFLGKVIRKFGPRNVYIVSYASMILALAMYPAQNWFARKAGDVDGWVWAAVVVQLGAMTLTPMAYGSMHMFTVDSAPSRSALGATTGLYQSINCVMRSTAPWFASSLFSISLEKQLVGGNMVYVVLLGIFLMGVRVSLFLPRELKMNSSKSCSH